jgi:hypothetical protein
MQVLDLGSGGPPLCPSCAVPMEDVPDADMVAEGPPQGPLPPLDSSWRGLFRGLNLVWLGLVLFFFGWGLVLIATFANFVFRLVDQDRAVALFVYLVFAASVLFGIVGVVLGAGRLYCCVPATDGPDRKRARDSAAAALVGALLWLALAVWTWVWLPDAPPLWLLLVGWLVALAVSAAGELMFLFWVRAAGKSLNDQGIVAGANWFFGGRGLYFAIGQVVLVLVALSTALILGNAEEPPSLSVDVALVLLVVLLGVAGTALVARYLRVVAAAQQTLDQRLTPVEGPKADEQPSPSGST